MYCLVLLSWLVGCRCAPVDTAPPVLPVMAHYSGWSSLVHAAGRGDLAQVRVEARDLTAGDPVASEEHVGMQGLDQVSASLGFLQAASSTEELGAGLGRAAEGCGACHEQREVSALDEPEWSHEKALVWVVSAAVWGKAPVFPKASSAAEVAIVQAYEQPVVPQPDTGKTKPPGTSERLQSVLEACWTCHPPDLGEGRDPSDVPTEN